MRQQTMNLPETTTLIGGPAHGRLVSTHNGLPVILALDSNLYDVATHKYIRQQMYRKDKYGNIEKFFVWAYEHMSDAQVVDFLNQE